MDIPSLHKALEHLPIPAVHYFPEIDSTNRQALDGMVHGTSEYTLYIAETQTSGRGRSNRRWITTPGASLAFSLVIHPSPEEGQKSGLFPLASALAVCLTVESLYRIHPEIKWPNDILLGGKKWCGILVESIWRSERLMGMVAGIGANLAQDSIPPDDEVLFPATCLADHTANPINATQLLASIVEGIIHIRSELLTHRFLDDYQSRLAFLGEPVMLVGTGGDFADGVLTGITEEGCLLLKGRQGFTNAYPAGDLRLRPKKGRFSPAH